MKNSKKICAVLFIIYIISLVYFVFFAEILGRLDVVDRFRYNIEPFKEILRFIKYYDQVGLKAVFVNVVGNVAVFVPFGYFVGIFEKEPKVMWKGIALALAFSVSIELIQLVAKVGICDVDDVILNTLGGAIGIILYRIIYALAAKNN